MRIAVYGGSFDPLHTGHLAIMRYLTESRAFGCIYLVISPQNPFKDPSKALTGESRYNDALEAVARHPELNVKVEDIELKMPAPHYSIRTLDALKEREPENDFTMVMGADSLSQVLLWKDADRLLTEYGVAAYPRSGYDLVQLRNRLLEVNPRYRVEIFDAPLVDISSTEIRENEAKGVDMSEFRM